MAALVLAAGLALPAEPGRAEAGLAAAYSAVVAVLPQWPEDARRIEEPEGSGVVLFDGSYVLTALHVVDQALSLRVRTFDGEVLSATLAARDRATDLALLSLPKTLPVLEFGPEVAPGDPVCALGNAFGLGLSLSCGVVSATGRAGTGFNPIEDFIQTDAAVNPGASGGALLSRDGRLVGVLSAIFTKKADANIGVNFAVSGPLAARVAEDLRTHGRVRYLAAGFRLDDTLGRGDTGLLGARVERIRSGSPAETAGFRTGDVVLAAGGRRIRKAADFVSRLAREKPPARLDVSVLRAGERQTLTLRFERAP